MGYVLIIGDHQRDSINEILPRRARAFLAITQFQDGFWKKTKSKRTPPKNIHDFSSKIVKKSLLQSNSTPEFPKNTADPELRSSLKTQNPMLDPNNHLEPKKSVTFEENPINNIVSDSFDDFDSTMNKSKISPPLIETPSINSEFFNLSEDFKKSKNEPMIGGSAGTSAGGRPNTAPNLDLLPEMSLENVSQLTPAETATEKSAAENAPVTFRFGQINGLTGTFVKINNQFCVRFIWSQVKNVKDVNKISNLIVHIQTLSIELQ